MKASRFLFITTICIALTFSSIHHSNAEEGSILDIFSGFKKLDYKQLFSEIVQKIKTDYVEETNEQELYEAAIEGMLNSLDPHSTFLDKKEFDDVKINARGEFGGLGIEVTMEKGLVKVISPYEDSPAFKAGIQASDLITMIEDKAVKGMTLNQAVELLRGKPNSKVTITIYRESTNESKEVTLTRELIRVKPVKAKIVSNDIAHLRLTTFNEKSPELLKSEFEKLNNKANQAEIPLKGVILDLRWNPGGLLEQSIDITELFLEEGTIVSTKGRIKNSTVVVHAKGNDMTNGLPIVVLINGGSASASEIVAGALQDNKRALIAGEKSFGKGSVQTIFPLLNGAAIKLTTSRYYTPSGRDIQARGIEPDVYIENAIITPIKLGRKSSEASLHGHLQESKKTNTKNDSLRISANLDLEKTDFQLIRAIDLVKGMALYSQKITDK